MSVNKHTLTIHIHSGCIAIDQFKWKSNSNRLDMEWEELKIGRLWLVWIEEINQMWYVENGAWDNKPQCSWSSLHILKFGTTKFHHESNTHMYACVLLFALAIVAQISGILDPDDAHIHTPNTCIVDASIFMYTNALHRVHASNKSSYKWCYRYSFITF